jgi:hypothetical protein
MIFYPVGSPTGDAGKNVERDLSGAVSVLPSANIENRIGAHNKTSIFIR